MKSIQMRKLNSLKHYADSLKIYIRGIKGASQLRHKLMSTETIDEARELLDEFEAKKK